MPHGPFTRVGARTLIRAKHTNELQEALENAPTMEDLPTFGTAKGALDSIGELPADGNSTGDWYAINGYIWLWSGTEWTNQGAITVGATGAPGADGEDGQGSIALPNALGAAGGFVLGDGQVTFTVFGADGLPIEAAVDLLVEALERDGVTLGGGGGAVDSVNGQTGTVVLDAGDVGALAVTDHRSGIIVLSTEWESYRDHPTLIKPLDDPILAFGDQSAASVYWPCFVDRRPIGERGVTLLYSTDHDGGAGGIYAAHADSPLGPFTYDSMIYQDTVDGDQTETPSVIWDEANSRYNLYYHNESVSGPLSQGTVLATTPDLETFSRVGLQLYSTGADHTGYFCPYRIGDTWYGNSLFTGGEDPVHAFWTSTNGSTWTFVGNPVTDPDLISHIDGYVEGETFVDWNAGIVIRWRGEVWWIGIIKNSGFNIYRYYAAPLDDTLLQFAAPVVDVTPPAQAWEGDGITGLPGRPIAVDGHVYFAYRAGGVTRQTGSFGLMEII